MTREEHGSQEILALWKGKIVTPLLLSTVTELPTF